MMDIISIIAVAFVAGIGSQLSAWAMKKVKKHYKNNAKKIKPAINNISFNPPKINLDDIGFDFEKKDKKE